MVNRYCENCEYSIRIGMGAWVCFNERAEDYTYQVEADECCDEWEEADV